MKLETSRNVTKSKRSLHWCRSISKKYLCNVLLQYQSKSYYIIGQEVYYSIGRFYYIIGQLLQYTGRFYYIIGQLLQYLAFITLSVGTGALSLGGPYRPGLLCLPSRDAVVPGGDTRGLGSISCL